MPLKQKANIDFKILRSNGLELQHIKQTFELCKVAVRQNGFALEFVVDQTEELCLIAVKQSGYALQFVKEQTELVCFTAIDQNKYAIQFVDKKFVDVHIYHKLLWG